MYDIVTLFFRRCSTGETRYKKYSQPAQDIVQYESQFAATRTGNVAPLGED